MTIRGFSLELAGFGSGGGEQPESAVCAIRIMTTAVPTGFLLLAIAIARGYPLSRTRHARILAELERPSREM